MSLLLLYWNNLTNVVPPEPTPGGSGRKQIKWNVPAKKDYNNEMVVQVLKMWVKCQ